MRTHGFGIFSRLVRAASAVIAMLIAGTTSASGAERIANGSFEGGHDGWKVWSGAFDGSVSQDATGGSLRLDFGPKSGGQAIAHQVVTLDQGVPSPFAYSCKTRPGNLPKDSIPGNGRYGVELCVRFQDGTSQWVSPRQAPDPCAAGWESVGGVFNPPRAVKEVVFHARLRIVGSAWFDAFSLEEFTPPRANAGGCSLKEEDGLYTLENDYLRAVFEPSRGGTCRSLVVKATGFDYAGERHPNARLFTDRFRVGGRSYDRSYSAEVVANGPGEVSLRLSLIGPKDFPFMVISKTFRLTSDSSALHCEYSYRNLPESMAPQVIEPWFRNGLAAFGRDGQCYVRPTPHGAQSIGPAGGDTYLANAVDGWFAVADGSSPALVCEFDFPHLAQQYFWLGGTDNTTAEWSFVPVEIAQGESFDTSLDFYPTPGVAMPDGAQNGICAAFRDGADGMLEAVVSSTRRILVDLVVETAAAGGPTQTVSRAVLLSPDAPVTLGSGARRDALAMARVMARDAATGRVVFEAMRPFSDDVTVPPAREKAKAAEVKPFELKLSEEVVTPHTKWMKPWAGGKPRVFFLVDMKQAREVVELAQRMDLDHRVVRFADNSSNLAWGMCDRYNQFTFADANLSLHHELERPLDAIVIAGNLWAKVDAANKGRIAQLATNGVGLVEIGMEKPILPDAAPDAAGTSWIVKAIDVALLPFDAGRASAFSHGGARVVRFGYPAHGGLTPFVPYNVAEPPFRYQDYSLGILARAVVWAAGKVAAVPKDAVETVEKVSAPGGPEIAHTWLRDGQGRICDWSARIAAPATNLTPQSGDLGGEAALNGPQGRLNAAMPQLVSDEAHESEMPFAIGYSGYRGWSRRYLDPCRFRQYRELGVNELRFWHTEDSPFFDTAKEMGFRMNFPVGGTHLWHFTDEFAEPYAKTGDKKYLCRKPCLNDPDYLTKTRERVRKTVRGFMRCEPTSFDCGDEGSLTLWGTPFDFCFSNHTLAAEREWLRGIYGSLEALNASWGTDFKNWDDVTPLTTDEAHAAHEADRRWAAWADHRRFMELTFCGFFAMIKEAVEAEAPGMPLDMSGTQQPNGYTGMDLWLLSKTIGIHSSYDNENIGEIIRSFGRPLVKPWYGYGASGPDVARRVWFDALRFKNYGVSYFTSDNFLLPDFTTPWQVRELLDALRFFREGGARLLRTLEERPQILIHYSQASIHAAQIERRYDRFLAARDVWCRLLDDLCIPYRFVAYGEIEEGELSRTAARIIVLPESSALSEKELAEIRAFANRGGLVVGDDLTATHDMHCNFLGKGALDDLFADGGPGVSIGRAMPRYLTLRATAKGATEAVRYRDGIGAKLASHLPDTGIRIQSEGISGVRTFVLHPMDGDNSAQRDAGGKTYLGFVREGSDNGSGGTVHVRLSNPHRVRDLRAGRDIGVVEAFDCRLAPCGATLYETERLK